MGNESILDTIKVQLGIVPENKDFDQELIMDINAVLFILYQLGLADKSYEIRDNTRTWDSILLKGEQPIALNLIIKWVGLRTRMLFDPPTSSILKDALEANIRELEFRGFITNNYVGEIGSLYGETETDWDKEDLYADGYDDYYD